MIKVQGGFYSGSRGEETPRYALLDGCNVAVTEIIRRQRAFDVRTSAIKDVFRCRLEDGRIVDIEKDWKD